MPTRLQIFELLNFGHGFLIPAFAKIPNPKAVQKLYVGCWPGFCDCDKFYIFNVAPKLFASCLNPIVDVKQVLL
jgi:hypothetical protein